MGYTGIRILLFFFLIHVANGQDYNIYVTNNCPHSQRQANNWYFGMYAGLSFNSGQLKF